MLIEPKAKKKLKKFLFIIDNKILHELNEKKF